MTGYCSCGEIKQRCHVFTASHSGNWVLVSKSNIFLKPASEYSFGNLESLVVSAPNLTPLCLATRENLPVLEKCGKL